MESAPIFCRWAAISVIASVLEQKVYVTTSAPLYPNLYVFLVGNAGIGKTRPIMAAAKFLAEIPEVHLAPNSVTMASLVDCMFEAKRSIVRLPESMIEYNSLTIIADELSAFMSEYSTELIGGLTTFYDMVPYGQARRTKDLRVKIKRPLLNILSGTTPSNLIRFVPEYAWEQGFTSRIVMVYSEERPMIDVFNTPYVEMPQDMIHDLRQINGLVGQFGWTEEYATAMHNWKVLGLPPVLEHPKLIYYNNRRFAHMLKLSMIASIDSGNALQLDKAAFNKAMGWLLEAEAFMPEIFRSGATGIDSKAMDEIQHFVAKIGKVSEHKLVNFTRERVPSHSVMRVIEIMEKSGMIQAIALDKMGMKIYSTLDLKSSPLAS